MPKPGMPSGALAMLILRVLHSGPLHGYAIAQRIHVLSSEVLEVEEGSLYPALQKILLKGWASAEWGISETNRKVRFYRLTPLGQTAARSRTQRLRPRNPGHSIRSAYCLRRRGPSWKSLEKSSAPRLFVEPQPPCSRTRS
jgi:PadR family transcriptional regulator PadR